jgi:hypothetical protein
LSNSHLAQLADLLRNRAAAVGDGLSTAAVETDWQKLWKSGLSA